MVIIFRLEQEVGESKVAEHILTLQEIIELFQKITMTMLGYVITGSPPDYTEAAKFVRIAWQTGSPAWGRDQDVCFIQVLEEEDNYNKQHDVEYESAGGDALTRITGETTVLKVRWICYGPNAYEKVRTIKRRIFYQDMHDVLAQSRIYILPDIRGPQRLEEEYEGKWWKRFDLEILFNALVVVEYGTESIASVDVVVAKGYDGNTVQVAEITIE